MGATLEHTESEADSYKKEVDVDEFSILTETVILERISVIFLASCESILCVSARGLFHIMYNNRVVVGF